MLISDRRIHQQLERIVASVSPEASIHEDLLQEALIHLWRVELERPGQAISWYLQSCRFRLRHCLSAGRSIDSGKRRNAQILELGEEMPLRKFFERFPANDCSFEETCTRDLVLTISLALKPAERAVLDCLADGLPTALIARRLHLSAPTVTKYRRKIAKLVLKLGIRSDSATRFAFVSTILVNGFDFWPLEMVATFM